MTNVVPFVFKKISELKPADPEKSNAYKAAINALENVSGTRAEKVMNEGVAAFRVALAMAEYQGNESAASMIRKTIEQLTVISRGVGFIMSASPNGAA